MIASLFARLEPEAAHRLALLALRTSASAGLKLTDAARYPNLECQVAGISFPNPLGLAAGVDKNAIAVPGLFSLGFGSVEVGTLTPYAQDGNARPRLFRLQDAKGLINRYGFNNDGIAPALERLKKTKKLGVLGINVGANKESSDFIGDFEVCTAHAVGAADYVTINVSSPNTPGLRDLQRRGYLDELLNRCKAKAGLTPLFLKIAPDLGNSDIDFISRTAIEAGVSALIVSNTTIWRPTSSRGIWLEVGGLSGRPLASLATQRLHDFRTATGGLMPLIATGGIDSGAEAYERIRAGANLVQIYTSLVFGGPFLPKRILSDLSALVSADGYNSIGEAVGSLA